MCPIYLRHLPYIFSLVAKNFCCCNDDKRTAIERSVEGRSVPILRKGIDRLVAVGWTGGRIMHVVQKSYAHAYMQNTKSPENAHELISKEIDRRQQQSPID